jgi:hypothetical protein
MKGNAVGIQEFYRRAMEILLKWLNRSRLSTRIGQSARLDIPAEPRASTEQPNEARVLRKDLLRRTGTA